MGTSFWHGASYGWCGEDDGRANFSAGGGSTAIPRRRIVRFSTILRVVAFAFCGANCTGITIRIDHLRSVAAAARRGGNSDAYYDYLGLAHDLHDSQFLFGMGTVAFAGLLFALGVRAVISRRTRNGEMQALVPDANGS